MLEARWAEGKFVCIGLDTVIEKLPKGIKVTMSEHHGDYTSHDYMLEFNKQIVDKTHDLVCAYKPNFAFYLAEGADGLHVLEQTCEYIRKVAPQVPIIIDCKVGDIDNTNEGTIKYIFKKLNADAITVAPYMGHISLEPFLKLADKGIIVICKTSNKGSAEFQNVDVKEPFRVPQKLYRVVAEHVSSVETWNKNHNCLLVVGATYPEELAEVRSIVADMPILIPGIGAQGGDLEKTLRAGLNSKKQGVIINSSRGIIYASGGSDFAERAREETLKLDAEIKAFLKTA